MGLKDHTVRWGSACVLKYTFIYFDYSGQKIKKTMMRMERDTKISCTNTMMWNKNSLFIGSNTSGKKTKKDDDDDECIEW